MGSALCVTRPHIIRSVWAAALPSEFADLLLHQYQSVLDRAEKLALELPEGARAAYFELVLYPVRMLCASGSTFINYQRYRNSLDDPIKSHEYAEAVTRWNRIVLENRGHAMTELACEGFKAQIELASDSEYLFPSPSPRAKKPYITSLRRIWEKTLRRAGVPYFPLYHLRHTFATRLSAGGVADHFVTQMLRQGDAQVFKRFSQAKLTMMREALAKLDRHTNEHPGIFGTARVN